MLRFVKTSRLAQAAEVKQSLLCFLIGLALFVCDAAQVTAQTVGQTPNPPEFAPGATGSITAPLMELQRHGLELGAELSERVTPQAPAEDAFSGVDFKDLRARALNHPRVRALLNAGDEETGADGQGGERYAGGRLFLLASFSIPPVSLRQMLEEAKHYGVPVIFRGFVNNSVYDTQDAIVRTFGSLEAAEGFVIDPTVFQRFQVAGVPLLIGTGSALDQCETPGCIDDPVPQHDAVRGNVPLEFALALMAERGALAAGAASDALARSQPQPAANAVGARP